MSKKPRRRMKSIKDVEALALRTGATVSRDDGTKFNTQGRKVTTKKPKAKPPALPAAPPPEPEINLETIATNIETAVEHMAAVNTQILDKATAVMSKAAEQSRVEQNDLVEILTDKLEQIDKAGSQTRITPDKWVFQITRNQRGFISKIEATPIYGLGLKN